jgi:hypothetical protein
MKLTTQFLPTSLRLGISLSLVLCTVLAAQPESVEVLRQNKWVPLAVAPLPASPTPAAARTVFGGTVQGAHTATGFFRVEFADGRWWFIDPAGGRFISRGLNSVNPRDAIAFHKSQNLIPLDIEQWARDSRQLIADSGFNTLGAWSADRLFTEPHLRVPYTRVLHLASAFGFAIGGAYPRFGNTGFTHGVPPVFHPDFAAFCADKARELVAPTRDDPWLIGYFSDNELPLRHDGIIGRYLDFPSDDANHQAASRWLASKYQQVNRQDITDADDRAFCRLVLETYFQTVATAIRQADPNHLLLGSRFHGLALNNDDLFRVAGQHIDVISVNYYHRWDVEHERLATWAQLAGRPLLISEFYARRIPGPQSDGPGAGFRVREERGRGLFYQHFAQGLAAVPACVGWHWHRFSDYADAATDITQGIALPNGQPHAEVLSIMRATNAALGAF